MNRTGIGTIDNLRPRDSDKPAGFSWGAPVLLALFATGLLLSCGRHSGSAQEAPPAPQSFEPAPRSSAADDVGRFLAGLPVTDDDLLRGLQSQPAWKAHSREIDLAWRKVEDEWLPAMRQFQESELSGVPLENSPLFYPFSGPDALMPAVFFPHSPVYVMAGLEPPGTLPTLQRFRNGNLSGFLAEMRRSVASETKRSFFITREMDRTFRGQVTDGLLPPILLVLARTRHTILGHRYVRLDSEGRVVERPAVYKAPGRNGNLGVQIDFRTDADQSVHQLFYFSVNLSDGRLRENKPFLAFLESLKGMATFFKATSYMPHRPGFSVIRERVLANSVAILQDDSGIPYRFFDAARWQIQLYGDYTRPYGSFRWLEQPDLRKAYETSGPKPLGFRIGYGFARAPSNLLLAKRKPAGAAPQK
jgi:hypothetical protein